MPKRGSYPATMFVATDEDEGTMFCDDEVSNFHDRQEVAIYQLVKVARVRQTVTVVDVRNPRRRRGG